MMSWVKRWIWLFIVIVFYACLVLAAKFVASEEFTYALIAVGVLEGIAVVCYIIPKITGEKPLTILKLQRPVRKIRKHPKDATIIPILKGDYPLEKRRPKLLLKGPLTWLERVVAVLLLVRTYVDWAYDFRRRFVTKDGDSQFIELYVLLIRLPLLLIALCCPMPSWLIVPIAALIGWELLGLILIPLRIVIVDRYSVDRHSGHRCSHYDPPDEQWAPYSFNRSLIFLFVNYCEMIIAFAYMYLHLGLVGRSDCANPIDSAREALYFSVVTITTLGYGDIRPISCLGRFFASVEPIMGIALIVVVLGLFFVELGAKIGKQ